ncbi:RrF2 family transcriptional regulator [Pseudemcibacter aquimaris]|uniref:RrF2 family transcriptional regulator n=1 Tax=Pseudemcibacter aquimaris TaxID=2857064 RepID=UPI00201301BA|nr:Rrf2 family transcriptional regulator [Pseudemcibacter aquimaris]MCC3862246.1 Rrf2 family transcriptional regulator [Pseudemcibacter aquimaris]WDU58998.1 Rrf2 family transcriptional regulator [Pseudemcibacter aquimaris]
MRLTSFTDYSVRVLTYVAKKNGELASIREVSEVYGISSNHLMKVIHHLGKGDYLETIRGKNGGFRLAKEPKDINIGELIKYTEEDMTLVECLGNKEGRCLLQEECNFSNVMQEALDAFMGTINKYTLADLIKGATPINFLDK